MCTVSGNNVQVVELPGVDLLLDSRPSHPEGHSSYRKLVHEEETCMTVMQLVLGG